jgi:mRNA interferase MazF
VLCGTANGLEQRSAVACDHITTIPATSLGRQIGHLLDEQETVLTDAIHAAFDLDS